MNKSLSIVIPWCNRPELKESLLKNQAFFDRENVEIIIANCGGQLPWLQLNITNLYKHQQIKVININAPSFNKCLAMNMGAHNATQPVLFFLDADIILKENFLDSALSKLNENENKYLCIERVYESSSLNKPENRAINLEELAYHTELIIQGKKLWVETNRINFLDNSRSAPGLVLLQKKHFLTVGGMDSHLEFWGWEDIDLQIRLQVHLNLDIFKFGSVIHLSHDDSVRRFRNNNRAESESVNFSLCLSKYNKRDYLGTYQQDTKEYNFVLLAL